MHVIVASTSYLQSVSANKSIQSLDNSLSTLMIQKNAIQDSDMSEQLKIEKTEAIEKKMQDLRDQMEKIKEARRKIEKNSKNEKQQKAKSEAITSERVIKLNSNGDEIREDIIISESLNEEINIIRNSHEEH